MANWIEHVRNLRRQTGVLSRYKLAALVAIGVLVIGTPLAFIASSSNAPATAGGKGGGKGPLSVQVTPVTDQTVAATIQLSGLVNSASILDVPAGQTGLVTSVLVAPGQSVTAGQTLAQLSSPSLRSTLAQAEAKVSGDEAKLAMDQATTGAGGLTQSQNTLRSAQTSLQAAQTTAAAVTAVNSPTQAAAEVSVANAASQLQADTGSVAQAANQANQNLTSAKNAQAQVQAQAQVNTAQTALTSAQSNLADTTTVNQTNYTLAAQAVTTAETSLTVAQSNLTQDQTNLATAQTNYDNAGCTSTTTTTTTTTSSCTTAIVQSYQQAESADTQASGQVSSDTQAVATAQDQLTATQAKDTQAADQAQSQVNAAQTELSNAQAALAAISSLNAATSAEIQAAQAALIAQLQAKDQAALSTAKAALAVTQAKDVLALSQATNQISQAQTALTNAQSGIGSAQVASADQLTIDQATVRADQAVVTNALAQVAALTVKAPFSGVVSQVPVTPGAVVLNATSLLTLVGNHLRVDVTLTPAQELELQGQFGDHASVAPAVLGAPAVAATLTQIYPTTNGTTQGFTAILTPTTPSGELKVGQPVTAQLTEIGVTGLAVPSSAIMYPSPTQPAVYVVTPGGAAGKGAGRKKAAGGPGNKASLGKLASTPSGTGKPGIAKLVDVTLGLQTSTLTEIHSGLQPGQLVVSLGQSYLVSGDQVAYSVAGGSGPSPSNSSTSVSSSGGKGAGAGGGLAKGVHATVKTVKPDQLTVSLGAKRAVKTVDITPSTIITKAGAKTTLSVITAGTKVVIKGSRGSNGVITASSISIG